MRTTYIRNPAIRSLVAVVLATIAACIASADVSVASLFTDNAVLQRDRRIPIWGTADAGEVVKVHFQNKTATTTTIADGTWQAWLDPMPATTQGKNLTITGKNTVVLRDVVVGDVWFCSGQSNMSFSVMNTTDAAAEIASGDFPLIRHLYVERTVEGEPARTVKTRGWIPASPKTVGQFTAVGYFFAREIHQNTGVPIGLIHSSWPGSPVEAWMSAAARASNPAFAVIEERYQKALAVFPEQNPPYLKALAEWQPGEATARAKGAAARAAYFKEHPAPREPIGPKHPHRPSGLFNGMVAPAVPYALRGFLWYQGEANSGRPTEYHDLFAALITDWRKQFGQGDIPFYWVQLPNFSAGNATATNWAKIREAQTQTLELPATGQVITIDAGDPADIHPTNKQVVGHRLALLAGSQLYGLKEAVSGPVFSHVTREGAALRVHFKNIQDGLRVKGESVTSLQLAGSDKKFFPATGKISGDTIVVLSPEVPDPVAVRYAWINCPSANLYNSVELPAAPFRSDEW